MELAEGNQKTVDGEFECEYDVEEIEEEVEEYEEEVEEEEEIGGGGLDRSAGEGEGVGSGDRRGDSPRKRLENVDNGEEEMKQADAATSSAGKIFVGGVAWDTTEECWIYTQEYKLGRRTSGYELVGNTVLGIQKSPRENFLLRRNHQEERKW